MKPITSLQSIFLKNWCTRAFQEAQQNEPQAGGLLTDSVTPDKPPNLIFLVQVWNHNSSYQDSWEQIKRKIAKSPLKTYNWLMTHLCLLPKISPNSLSLGVLGHAFQGELGLPPTEALPDTETWANAGIILTLKLSTNNVLGTLLGTQKAEEDFSQSWGTQSGK